MDKPFLSSRSPALNYENRGYSIYIVTAFFGACTLVITILRIVKFWIRPRPQLDDLLFLIALMCNVATDASDTKAAQSGMGRHMDTLTQQQINDFRLWSELGIFFAVLSVYFSKVLICEFLLRMLRQTHKKLRWTTYVLLTITTLACIASCVVWGLQAHPLKKLWDPTVPGWIAPGHQVLASNITVTVSNAVTDLFYALIPLTFIPKLQMNIRKKLIVLGLTSCGLLVFTASMVKMIYSLTFYTTDETWGWLKIWLASSFERNLAFITACLPSSMHIYRSIRKKLTGSHTGTGTGNTKNRYGTDRSSHAWSDTNTALSEDEKAALKRKLGDGGVGGDPRDSRDSSINTDVEEQPRSRSSMVQRQVEREVRRPEEAVMRMPAASRSNDQCIMVQRDYTVESVQRSNEQYHAALFCTNQQVMMNERL